MHETLIKRTIWESRCPHCGIEKVAVEEPPKERLCECGEWVPYVEQSYTSPEYKGAQK